jgi:hypothetical protein
MCVCQRKKSDPSFGPHDDVIEDELTRPRERSHSLSSCDRIRLRLLFLLLMMTQNTRYIP